jgi:hypothetical protein
LRKRVPELSWGDVRCRRLGAGGTLLSHIAAPEFCSVQHVLRRNTAQVSDYFICLPTFARVYCSGCGLPKRWRPTEVAVGFAWQCGCHRQAVPILKLNRMTQTHFGTAAEVGNPTAA